jgi:hypothetical protein
MHLVLNVHRASFSVDAFPLGSADPNLSRLIPAVQHWRSLCAGRYPPSKGGDQLPHSPHEESFCRPGFNETTVGFGVYE